MHDPWGVSNPDESELQLRVLEALENDHHYEALHSSVVALNVLEHVADDAGALRGCVCASSGRADES